MKEFETLFGTYDNIVFFDTETTGLYPCACQIIEIAAISLQRDGTRIKFDEFVSLRDPSASVPENIVELTGITDDVLRAQGIDEETAAASFADLLCGYNPYSGDAGHKKRSSEAVLLVAHNAHFDLSFVRGWLKGKMLPKRIDFLDTLTVFKDRRAYPHKLANAIEAYHLENAVQNTHRAIDDVFALAAVTSAMDRERNDLLEYVNLFGYNAKYGKPSDGIRGVRYVAQPFHDAMTTPRSALYAQNQY